MSGQTQKSKSGKEWQYYRRERGRHIPCKHFSSIKLEMLERAVFETILLNTVDEPAFNEAIKESLPDEDYIHKLEAKIKEHGKELQKIESDIDSLYEWTKEFKPSKEAYKKRETSLLKVRQNIHTSLKKDRNKLERMPDVEKIRKQASEFVFLCSIDSMDTVRLKIGIRK